MKLLLLLFVFTAVPLAQTGSSQAEPAQEETAPDAPQTYLQFSGSDPQTTRGESRLLHYLPQDLPITVYVPIPGAGGSSAQAGGTGGAGGVTGGLDADLDVDLSEVDLNAARRDEVVRALNAWQEAVPDLVRFRTAETPEESSLKVVWRDLPPGQVGSYRYTFSVLENGLYRFRATEIILDPDTPPDDLYRYALLEIGHALGLLGRSPFEGDAMSAVPSGRVSERDVATLRALYALPSGIVLRK